MGWFVVLGVAVIGEGKVGEGVFDWYVDPGIKFRGGLGW